MQASKEQTVVLYSFSILVTSRPVQLYILPHFPFPNGHSKFPSDSAFKNSSHHIYEYTLYTFNLIVVATPSLTTPLVTTDPAHGRRGLDDIHSIFTPLYETMPNPGLGDAILHLLPLARKGSRRAPYGEKDASRLSKGYAYSDDRLIWLSFVHLPKDGRRFVFGADNTCDVRIVGKKISDRHFAIILCPSSGIPLLVNGSSFGTLVGSKFLSRKNESHVLEQNVTIACGDFRCMVITPDRGKYQKKYEENLLKYLRQLKVPAEDISIHATPIQSHRRVGQFLEIANLGCGGFGEVSLFADSKTGEVHAAKRFRDKNNFDAILKEMDTLKKLSHVRYSTPR